MTATTELPPTDTPGSTRGLLGCSLIAVAALGGGLGCSCNDEKPYTPFQVATSLPDEPPLPSVPVPLAEVPETQRKTARAPAGARLWTPFHQKLVAPPGTVFVAAVEPADEAETPQATIAWVSSQKPTPAAAKSSKAGLWAFPAQGAPHLLTAVPQFLPTSEDCSMEVALNPSGERAVSVSLETSCKDSPLPGTPTGAILLVQSDLAKPIKFSGRTLGHSPGEELSYRLVGQDRDGDGIDDVELTVQLQAPSGSQASTSFLWLDRPAGLSRQADSPGAVLQAQARALTAAVKRKEGRDAAIGRLDALRRLLFSVCAESRSERVRLEAGAGIECGPVKAVSAEITGALIDAELWADRPWKALGHFHRRNDYFGPVAASTANTWRSLLQKKANSRAASQTADRPSPAGKPLSPTHPIAYDGDRLYAIDATGHVSHLGEQNLGLGGAPPGPTPWPTSIESRMGKRLSAAVPSCQRSEITLMFSTSHPGTSALTEQPLALLAPRPGGCGTLGGQPVTAEALEFHGEALWAIVNGEPITTAGEFTPPVKPLAYGTDAGLAVWSSKGFELWDVTAPTELKHCVAQGPDGTHPAAEVSCLRGRRVVSFRASID